MRKHLSLLLVLATAGFSFTAFAAETDTAELPRTEADLEALCRTELGYTGEIVQPAFIEKIRRCMNTKRRSALTESLLRDRTSRIQQSAVDTRNAQTRNALIQRARFRTSVKSSQAVHTQETFRAVRTSIRRNMQMLEMQERLKQQNRKVKVDTSIPEELQECLNLSSLEKWLCVNQKNRWKALQKQR